MTPVALLAAWEDACGVPECAVGAVLLHRSGFAGGTEDILDLPVAEVAALLATVWISAYGVRADGVVTCPGCAEELEIGVPMDALAALSGSHASVSVGADLVVRCPSTRDLLAVTSGASEPGPALFARCLTDVDGDPVDPGTLTAAERDAVEAAAERLAGAAAATVSATCPACGERVRAELDVTGMVWQRVRAEVPVLLAEVAELAGAFGWSESAVLELSPVRRAAYLELVRS